MIAAAVVLGCLAFAIGYSVFKRPGDVSDPDAPFSSSEPPPRRGSTNWPTYGANNAKTRFLPRRGLKPPFRRLWSYHSQGVLTEFSPVLAGTTIYGIDKHAIAYALNSENGKPLWRRKVGELNASSPAIDNGRVFIANLEPGQVVALDAATGKRLWRFDLPDRSETSPVVEGDLVVVGCESGDLFALDASTGKVAWQRELGGAIKGGPAIHNGIVFAGDYGGELSAVRLTDGSIKWQTSDVGREFSRSGSFYSTPAVAFGRVYIGNKDGRMYSFVEETGKLAWAQSTGGEVYSAPAVADTPTAVPSVYFGSGDTVYALDAETGKERWTRPAGGAVLGAGSVVGQIFYVANVSKRATAGFATKTGKRVFGSKAGAYNPVISDGRRIYLTGYAGLLALKPRPSSAALSKKQKRAREKAAEKKKGKKKKKKGKKKSG